MSENGEDERGGEAEHLQAPPSSPLCEQESSDELPEVVGQAAMNETASTVGDLLLASSRDTIIIHATEDKFMSIE